jgi:hypothetical protein
MFAVQLNQLPRTGESPQLFAQLAPLLAAAQAEFPHQLLVTGAAAGQTLDVAQQIAVCHTRSVIPGSMVLEPCLCFVEVPPCGVQIYFTAST